MEAHQLPIHDIHCTEGDLKASLLKELGCQLHFDDSEGEAISNYVLGIQTILVSWKFDSQLHSPICSYELFNQ